MKSYLFAILALFCAINLSAGECCCCQPCCQPRGVALSNGATIYPSLISSFTYGGSCIVALMDDGPGVALDHTVFISYAKPIAASSQEGRLVSQTIRCNSSASAAALFREIYEIVEKRRPTGQARDRRYGYYTTETTSCTCNASSR